MKTLVKTREQVDENGRALAAGRPIFHQAFLFALIGIMNTAVDFLVFLLLTQVFSLFYGFSQVISYGAGMVNSYLWNSKVTFSVSKKSRGRLVKFILLNLIVLGITLTLMHFLLFLPLIVNKLISTIAGLMVNFILSKTWVFKA
ncbi:MAG: GtrA family protein [Sporolactobacillus sp.]